MPETQITVGGYTYSRSERGDWTVTDGLGLLPPAEGAVLDRVVELQAEVGALGGLIRWLVTEHAYVETAEAPPFRVADVQLGACGCCSSVAFHPDYDDPDAPGVAEELALVERLVDFLNRDASGA